MVAVWGLDDTRSEITLSVEEGSPPTITGMFGRTEIPAVRDGAIQVTVGRNPVFIAPLPASLQDR
jgi:hypothetical protein